MKFVNRKSELEILRKEYDSKYSSFVIIYGRRRIGKTRLIKEFMKGKKGVYFVAVNGLDIQNREAFQKILSQKIQSPLLKSSRILDWEDMFYIISQHVVGADEKFIIALDEFQYLINSNKSISSILQKCWDEYLQDKKVMLIISGSSLSLMERELLSISSPLYGRRTSQIKLMPIKFRYFNEFFVESSGEELVELYSLVGGVPKYAEMLSREGNILTTIKRNFLNPNSFFYDEPIFLLEKEISEIGSYFSILHAIASGRRKIGKMASYLETSQHKLSYYLSRLVEIGILERIVPITEKSPQKSKKGYYKIKDYFLDFWFKYIYPYRSYIEIGEVDYVLKIIEKTFIEKHVSFVYEDLCREKLLEIIATGDLKIEVSKIGSWWDKETEIDIVGVNESGKPILFGEVKYSKKLLGIEVYYDLIEKSRKLSIKEGTKPLYIIFSPVGFSEELKSLSKDKDNIVLVRFP